jgi:hypothetical protein
MLQSQEENTTGAPPAGRGGDTGDLAVHLLTRYHHPDVPEQSTTNGWVEKKDTISRGILYQKSSQSKDERAPRLEGVLGKCR